ncbi:hypothetical protein LISE100100_00370 [Listeria seeligeri]|uniref:hypothetical protein n=1 Tax=Listeria seeligeri TaxID=1640 RepID=UPI0001C4EC4A|nr:hypothetical protein [Listeria seeligeri]CBH27750.1 phage-related protein, putative [Listeria seeligeri serovar 1/2b str. SLCC3954]
MFGITFLNKHSFFDYGLVCKEKNIGFPEKNKIKEVVPFSSKTYDFSTMYGVQTYSERELSYTFYVYDDVNSSIEAMTAKKIRAANWLLNSTQTMLMDDDVEGYYFLAEVTDVDFPEEGLMGQLKVSFTAYPFKIRTEQEGSDFWDAFNFEADMSQSTTFYIAGTETVTIMNLGTNDSSVEIESTGLMEITNEKGVFKAPKGISQSDNFFFSPGKNVLTISGYGTITFTFHREVL